MSLSLPLAPGFCSVEAEINAVEGKISPMCLPHISGSATLLNILDRGNRKERISRRLVAVWSLAPPKLSTTGTRAINRAVFALPAYLPRLGLELYQQESQGT